MDWSASWNHSTVKFQLKNNCIGSICVCVCGYATPLWNSDCGSHMWHVVCRFAARPVQHNHAKPKNNNVTTRTIVHLSSSHTKLNCQCAPYIFCRRVHQDPWAVLIAGFRTAGRLQLQQKTYRELEASKTARTIHFSRGDDWRASVAFHVSWQHWEHRPRDSCPAPQEQVVFCSFNAAPSAGYHCQGVTPA